MWGLFKEDSLPTKVIYEAELPRETVGSLSLESLKNQTDSLCLHTLILQEGIVSNVSRTQ